MGDLPAPSPSEAFFAPVLLRNESCLKRTGAPATQATYCVTPLTSPAIIKEAFQRHCCVTLLTSPPAIIKEASKDIVALFNYGHRGPLQVTVCVEDRRREAVLNRSVAANPSGTRWHERLQPAVEGAQKPLVSTNDVGLGEISYRGTGIQILCDLSDGKGE